MSPFSFSHIPSLFSLQHTISLTLSPINSPTCSTTLPDVKRGSQQYCGYHSGGTCPSSLAPSVVVQFAFFFDLANDNGCDSSGQYSPTLSSTLSSRVINTPYQHTLSPTLSHPMNTTTMTLPQTHRACTRSPCRH